MKQLVLGPHYTANVYFGTGDVGVYVYSACHHHFAAGIDDFGFRRNFVHYLVVANGNVHDIAVHAIFRIVDVSVFD